MDQGYAEREQYRLDTIYSILEKGLYPVKFADLREKYGEMTLYYHSVHEKSNHACSPFYQVQKLLDLLGIQDVVIFKKVYDAYINAVLQINPKLMNNAAKALEHLKDKGCKISIISNTGKTPGDVLRLLLKEMGIFHFFDDMLYSDEVGVLKPHPLIFDLAVERLGAVKTETLFIGDIKYCDVDGAQNAGLAAHLFNREEDDLFQLAVNYSGGY